MRSGRGWATEGSAGVGHAPCGKLGRGEETERGVEDGLAAGDAIEHVVDDAGEIDAKPAGHGVGLAGKTRCLAISEVDRSVFPFAFSLHVVFRQIRCSVPLQIRSSVPLFPWNAAELAGEWKMAWRPAVELSRW